MGIHCRHGRRTVAAWANEIADLLARQSRNAIDRRNDPRETEVALGSCLCSFGSLDGGFRRFHLRPGSRDRGPRGEIGLDGIVEFLGRDGACFCQRRITFDVELGLALIRPGALDAGAGFKQLTSCFCKLPFCPSDCRLKRPRINFKEWLTFPDKRTLCVNLPEQISGHLCLYICVDHSVECCDPLPVNGNVSLLDRRHFDLERSRRLCLHRIRAALSDKQSKAEKADLLWKHHNSFKTPRSQTSAAVE